MVNKTTKAKYTLVNEQDRLLTYFPKGVQQLVAKQRGNIETQRDILMAHAESTHPGLVRLFSDNYYAELDIFIETIENKNKSIVTETQDEKMGFKPIRVAKKTNAKKPVEIRSKTKSGNTYVRTKSQKFENKQATIQFVKNQKQSGLTYKEITEKYNALAERRGWQLRTESSLKTVYLRSKKNG